MAKEYDALQLFENGGILLFYDVPSNTEFGIDYNCWRTGDKFKGVKMIPPGIHFIYLSITDKYGNVGLRNGFFHNFKQKEVLAKKWSKQNEMMEDYELTEDQLDNFKRNKFEMDKYLGAYPFDEYKRWISLTNQLNEPYLKVLIPESKFISSGSTLIGKSFTKSKDPNSPSKKDLEFLKKPESLQEAEKRLPEMNQMESTIIRFSKIPQGNFSNVADPTHLTKMSIDMSQRLDSLILQQASQLDSNEQNPSNVLCELQFAFVCFLIGHVFDAFEQWKTFINLLCNCEDSIQKYPNLYIDLIQVLYFQLKEMPQDFFTDIITSNNFLIVNFHNLFDNIAQTHERINNINDSNTKQSLIKLNQKCNQFKSYLQEKFKFDFDLEPDEYAPVICEDNQ